MSYLQILFDLTILGALAYVANWAHEVHTELLLTRQPFLRHYNKELKNWFDGMSTDADGYEAPKRYKR